MSSSFVDTPAGFCFVDTPAGSFVDASTGPQDDRENEKCYDSVLIAIADAEPL